MKPLRSVASVVLGYIVVFAMVLASDPALMRLFPGQYVANQVPPTFLLWITTAIFAVASIVGGWVCVRLAPARPWQHLLVLFLVGEVLGVVTTALNWGKWPHWHALAWLAIWPVCLAVGAMGRRRSTEPAVPAIP
jgi:nitrate/nitrite transporter NarK